MCTSYVFVTMFMYSLYSYLDYVFTMLVLGLYIQYVGTSFMYAVCWYNINQSSPRFTYILINHHQDLHMIYLIVT